MKSFWQSFFRGVGFLFSWLTPPRCRPKTPEEIEQECGDALAKDWQAVGDDLQAAMRQVEWEKTEQNDGN